MRWLLPAPNARYDFAAAQKPLRSFCSQGFLQPWPGAEQAR
jgi:hypothetical protein